MKKHGSIVLNNFNMLLNRIKELEDSQYIVQDVFRSVMKMPNSEKFVEENVDSIIQNTSPENIFEVVQCLKGNSQNVDHKLNQTLEEHKLDVARYLLGICCNATNYKRADNILLDKYAKEFVSLLDKILQNEHVRMIDMKKLGSGSYSTVFQIGEKVLKVGATKEVNDVLKHSRILQPILERDFMDSGNKPFACLEISKKAEKLQEEDYVEDKLYEIYKDLRKDGIIWTDVKFSNVGKIDGTLVIIDHDYIYSEGNNNIVWPKNTFGKTFERRYLQEKTLEVSQNFTEKDNNQISEKTILEQRGE